MLVVVILYSISIGAIIVVEGTSIQSIQIEVGSDV